MLYHLRSFLLLLGRFNRFPRRYGMAPRSSETTRFTMLPLREPTKCSLPLNGGHLCSRSSLMTLVLRFKCWYFPFPERHANPCETCCLRLPASICWSLLRVCCGPKTVMHPARLSSKLPLWPTSLFYQRRQTSVPRRSEDPSHWPSPPPSCQNSTPDEKAAKSWLFPPARGTRARSARRRAFPPSSASPRGASAAP